MRTDDLPAAVIPDPAFTDEPDVAAASGPAAAEPGEEADSFAPDEVPTQPVQYAEPVESGEPAEPGEPVAPAVPARFVRLGADGLARLRARYADIAARIEGQDLDEAGRTELVARVARLNPDAWESDEEVGQALEEYETVFESLRPFIGRPSRRRRP